MRLQSALRGVAFVALAMGLGIAGGMFGIWQMTDHLVFRSLYLTQPPAPGTGIRLIDLDYPDDVKREQPQRYREALASALTQLAALSTPPRTVLIDVWISNNPAGADAIVKGIAALHQKSVKVYAAVDPKDRHGKDTADFMKAHHEAIYTSALDGYGHTQLEYGFGVLKYQRELTLQTAAGELRLPALPVRAAMEGDRADALPASLIIPLGSDAAFKPLTHRLSDAAARIEPPLPADGSPNYAIIGSFAEDSDNVLRRPGPLLLAWALSDLTAGKASVAREPLNHPFALLGLAALAASLAWAFFALAFRIMRGRVAPSRWSALAHGLAPAAFLAAAVMLLSAGAIVLLAGRVIPVAFPMACAALASTFAWISARRWIAEEQVRRELGHAGEERAVQYDVFVSYAHDPPENKAWVKSAIVAPLEKLRHADGTPYRVFFDEASIKIGRKWKTEIELALLGTRCFLPVYSERYFERPYCREEIEIADQLRIEGRLRMFPIARQFEGIPERYLRKVQYIDARANPEFMQELIEQIGSQPCDQRLSA
ncbi:MAG TPA: toll/interleukin-1 receptor domain-containing protein [Burkholderiales bacterium]|nr:toll/interleukin-1 receptor domain-containing protein [Burkholderiales bacterium]